MFNIPPVQIAIGGKSELRLTRKGYKRGVQEFRSSGVQAGPDDEIARIKLL
jgi:hypothetical protein